MSLWGQWGQFVLALFFMVGLSAGDSVFNSHTVLRHVRGDIPMGVWHNVDALGSGNRFLV